MLPQAKSPMEFAHSNLWKGSSCIVSRIMTGSIKRVKRVDHSWIVETVIQWMKNDLYGRWQRTDDNKGIISEGKLQNTERYADWVRISNGWRSSRGF